MTIRKVGVIGCGLMGSGIAQMCAQSGYTVAVREINDELLKKGLQRIRNFLAEGVNRAKIKQEAADRALAAISGTTKLADLADCDLVLEAAIENLDEKKNLFAELDRLCKSGTILATNTSSLSITVIAGATKRPDRCVGLHFFNPVPLMKLVELVRGEGTGDETFTAAKAFAESLGKTVVPAKDTPGFIVNLLLIPYVCEAIAAVDRGTASAEDVDTAMRLACGMPMGPIELADFIGLDTTLSIMDILFQEFHDTKYAAPAVLRRMVAAGRLGRKTGRGFYEHLKK